MTDKAMHEKFGLSEYSLKYPANNSSPVETWISVLMAFLTSLFVVPLFVLFGYLSRVRKASLNEDDTAPKFENYKELAELGAQCFIAYTPVLFVIAISIVSTYFIPFMIGVAGIPLMLWPIISVKFAETEDYKQVYDGEILDIITHSKYARYLSIYVFLYIVVLAGTITFGILSAGIGVIIFVPVFVWFRAAYWGRAIKEIRKQIEFEEELEEAEGN